MQCPVCVQVEVIDGKLFATFLKLTDLAMKKSFNNLREKPDRSRWISTGTTVNAFYSAILNSVSKYQFLLIDIAVRPSFHI